MPFSKKSNPAAVCVEALAQLLKEFSHLAKAGTAKSGHVPARKLRDTKQIKTHPEAVEDV